MVDPHGVKVPKFDLSADSFNAAQESMQHVSEHVAAVKGDDRDEVGEPKENVHPHQPEEEVGAEHQHLRSQHGRQQAVPCDEQGLLKGMNGDASKFERNHEDGEDVKRKRKSSLGQRCLKPW